MAAAFPGQFNTYIPSTEATDNLIADFSRNPDRFKLAEWCQYLKVEKNKGFFTEMTVEQAGRIVNTDGDDMRWADGNEAPRQSFGAESFEFKPYVTERYVSGFELGEMAAEQASWDVLAQHARIHAQRMMTFRTVKALSVAQNSSNYDVTVDIAAPPADLNVTDKLDVSTTSEAFIKRTFDYAAEQIYQRTLGAVQQSDICFVMNPLTARRLSVAPELRETLIQSPYAMQIIDKQIGPDTNWGLPNQLFGYKIVCEDAVKVTSIKGATAARSYAMDDGVILAVSRPGGLVGVEGSPSFSTFQVFLKTEMLVESKHDQDNKRHVGRVIDDFDVRMVAPLAGVYINNVLTA
jgi:hypothetical protein